MNPKMLENPKTAVPSLRVPMMNANMPPCLFDRAHAPGAPSSIKCYKKYVAGFYIAYSVIIYQLLFGGPFKSSSRSWTDFTVRFIPTARIDARSPNDSDSEIGALLSGEADVSTPYLSMNERRFELFNWTLRYVMGPLVVEHWMIVYRKSLFHKPKILKLHELIRPKLLIMSAVCDIVTKLLILVQDRMLIIHENQRTGSAHQQDGPTASSNIWPYLLLPIGLPPGFRLRRQQSSSGLLIPWTTASMLTARVFRAFIIQMFNSKDAYTDRNRVHSVRQLTSLVQSGQVRLVTPFRLGYDYLTNATAMAEQIDRFQSYYPTGNGYTAGGRGGWSSPQLALIQANQDNPPLLSTSIQQAVRLVRGEDNDDDKAIDGDTRFILFARDKFRELVEIRLCDYDLVLLTELPVVYTAMYGSPGFRSMPDFTEPLRTVFRNERQRLHLRVNGVDCSNEGGRTAATEDGLTRYQGPFYIFVGCAGISLLIAFIELFTGGGNHGPAWAFLTKHVGLF